MIGWGFTLHAATSRPVSSVKPASSVLNGRTLTSSFAASPRISYRSTWWNAIKQRGFVGWRQLIGRSMAERTMTDAERTAKITRAKSDISFALKSNGGNAEEWRKNFHKILRNAAWYEVDVDAQIRSAFQMMTSDELVVLRTVCGTGNSLNFLKNKIAERVAEMGFLKTNFEAIFSNRQCFILKAICWKASYRASNGKK